MKKKNLYIVLILSALVSIFLFKSISLPAKSTGNLPKESNKLLHFVQLSDTHINYSNAKDTNRLLGSSQQLLQKAVEQVNAIPNLDFVLFSGDFIDFTDKELLQKFINITNEIKYPVYVLLGNHEMYVGPGNQDSLKKENLIKVFYNPGLKQLFQHPFKTRKSFHNKKTYYSFLPNTKFKIICLDLAIQEHTSNGQIPDEELEWLKHEISQDQDKYIIIASHFPLIEPYPSKSHYVLSPGREKLLQVIESSPNVIGYFSGHYHAARLFKINGKIHNSNPALIEYPNAFREISITKNPNDNKNINVEFKFHTVNLPDLVTLSKKALGKKAELNSGKETDRDQIIQFSTKN